MPARSGPGVPGDTVDAGLVRPAGAHDHVVGFYDTEAYLAEAVATFLAPAAHGEAVALVIATPEHDARIRTALAEHGVGVLDPERYRWLDADATLEAISRDGQVDPARFEQVIGGLVEDASRYGDRVVAFGEMVALLWEAGDVAGAVQLEACWNELARTHRFALLCGYPTSAFGDDLDTARFRAVCQAHTTVLPSESFAGLTDPDDRLRAVALLQQQEVAAANERQALRAKQAELEEALERLAEVDRMRRQFVAMVVHDIRNPTIVISGLLDLLAGSWRELDEAELREHLTIAGGNARRIHRLLDDVLLMSRLESGTFTFDLTPVDLGGVVREVVAQVRDTSGREVTVTVPADLPPVLADEGRQVQVLGNLVSNAVKFSPATARVEIGARVEDGCVRVEVRDTGPGIAPDDLDKLFRPFSRLTPRGARQPSGTGLGLFISKALVEGQGGRLEAASTPGLGTTFAYTVPLAR